MLYFKLFSLVLLAYLSFGQILTSNLSFDKLKQFINKGEESEDFKFIENVIVRYLSKGNETLLGHIIVKDAKNIIECKAQPVLNYEDIRELTNSTICMDLQQLENDTLWNTKIDVHDSYATVYIYKAAERKVDGDSLFEVVYVTCCLNPYKKNVDYNIDKLDIFPLDTNETIYNINETLSNVSAEIKEPVISVKEIPESKQTSLILIAYHLAYFPLNSSLVVNPRIKERKLFQQGRNILKPSSCQCDLTHRFCDVYCCCDEECSKDARDVFGCSQDVQEGTSISIYNNFECSKNRNNPGFEFRSFLCLEKINSPYLGYFYPTKLDPSDQVQKYSTIELFGTKRPLWNMESIHFNVEDVKMLKVKREPFYKHGDALQIAHDILNPTFLALPYSVFYRHCTEFKPVQFLLDQSSVCISSVREACGPTQIFKFINAQYLAFGQPPFNTRIMDAPNSKRFVPVRLKVSSYGEDLDLMENPLSDSPTRDDVKAPFLSENICRNVVLEADYAIYWREGKLLVINITLVMGDVALEPKGFSQEGLAQKFQVRFLHLPRPRSDEGNTPQEGLGYTLGSQLIGQLTSDLLGVVKLNLWNQNLNPFCDLTRLRPVTFGDASLSSCLYQIHNFSALSCDEINANLLKLHDHIFDASHLLMGRGSEDSLVPIFKIPFSWKEEDATNNSRPEFQKPFKVCPEVPYAVELVVFTDEPLARSRLGGWQVVGARLHYHTTEWACQGSSCSHSTAFEVKSMVSFVAARSQSYLHQKRFYTHPHNRHWLKLADSLLTLHDFVKPKQFTEANFWFIFLTCFLIPFIFIIING